MAAGLAGWAAHPPVGLGYSALLVLPLLLGALALGRSGARRSFALGGLAGCATFLPLLTWLIEPAGLLAWFLLSMVMAAWYGLAAAAIGPWVRGPWVIGIAPLVWTGMELWRNRVPLSGFGWASLADAQTETVLLPAARVIGGVGLTFTVALIGTLAFVAARYVRSRPVAGVTTGLCALVVAAVAALAPPPAPDPSGSLDVLAVQGNDMPYDDFVSARDRHLAIADRMLGVTRTAVGEGGQPDLTVWPESAIDRDPYGGGDYLLAHVEEAAALLDGSLLFGAILDGPRPATFRNSLVLVQGDAEPRDAYVKRRYVPFGEYVPWRSVLGDFPPLRQVPRDGIPGDGPQTVTVDGVSIAPLICFETLFSDLVRDNVRAADVGLIVAATNDASFGRSSEPAQHIAQSRLRAVESGRWVVHSALSGASALIDPDGRVHEQTELFVRDTIRAEVPVITTPTPFLAIGDLLDVLVLAGAAVVALGTGVVAWRRGRT